MDKIWIIIKREFLHRVKKKSFLLLTIFIPFLFAAIVYVPLWLSELNAGDQERVAVVDATGAYAAALQDTERYHFFTAPASELSALQSDTSGVSAIVMIQADSAGSIGGVEIGSSEQVSGELVRYVEGLINAQVRLNKLRASGIDNLDAIIADVQQGVSVQTLKWDEHGAISETSSEVASMVGLMLSLLVYMFVLSYGSMVMQGVMEEKTNRIVELMVSSVKPFQLMIGKIIGIALVGLVQFGIWALMFVLIVWGALVFFAPSAGAVGEPSFMQATLQAFTQLPICEMLTMFLLLFVGGYLLYAAFFAAIGASVNEPSDSSQFLTPVMLIMAFALYAGLYSIENTNGPLAFWCSLIPFTSPIVMMVRLPFGVPLWQEVLSIGILWASALLLTWLSGKIYRVGILMYGKKPTLREMLRWVRFK